MPAPLPASLRNYVIVIEDCPFRDVTGQRFSKAVKSVARVEGRLNAIIDIRGKSALDEIDKLFDRA